MHLFNGQRAIWLHCPYCGARHRANLELCLRYVQGRPMSPPLNPMLLCNRCHQFHAYSPAEVQRFIDRYDNQNTEW